MTSLWRLIQSFANSKISSLIFQLIFLATFGALKFILRFYDIFYQNSETSEKASYLWRDYIRGLFKNPKFDYEIIIVHIAVWANLELHFDQEFDENMNDANSQEFQEFKQKLCGEVRILTCLHNVFLLLSSQYLDSHYILFHSVSLPLFLSIVFNPVIPENLRK